MNVEEDVTILIDFNKYQQIHPANAANSSNITKPEVCAGLENAVYQKCGTKCVLACRFTTIVLDLGATLKECDKNECIEGCFCKDGFVRYQDKCILPKECPIRSNKSIEFDTKMPSNPLGKRIIKPSCSGSSGCMPPPKPCLPFLCNNGGNQNSGEKKLSVCC